MIPKGKIKKIRARVGKEDLSIAIIANNSVQKPNFVYLHGAGGSTKERAFALFEFILKSTSGILAFDFSGHGESSGTLTHSSLKKRVMEAKKIIDKYADKESLVICGSSMGAYIAAKMLEYFDVKSLILFCPAMYDKKSFNLRFDKGFTKAIRKPGSWKQSDGFSLIKKFSGNLFVCIGEKDEVIPKEAITLLSENSKKTKKKEIIVIPRCPHTIHKFLDSHVAIQKKVAKKIRTMISLEKNTVYHET